MNEYYVVSVEEKDLPIKDRAKEMGDGPSCNALSTRHFICTKALGHSGDHVAHGASGNAFERWDNV